MEEEWSVFSKSTASGKWAMLQENVRHSMIFGQHKLAWVVKNRGQEVVWEGKGGWITEDLGVAEEGRLWSKHIVWNSERINKKTF